MHKVENQRNILTKSCQKQSGKFGGCREPGKKMTSFGCLLRHNGGCGACINEKDKESTIMEYLVLAFGVV